MIGRVYTLAGAYWRVVARGEPFDRGPRRNVLLERLRRVEHYRRGVLDRLEFQPTGERMVRPFRGLRRA